MMQRPMFTQGGYQDPSVNRGGPGNPGTAHNTRWGDPSNSQTARFRQDPRSPAFGSGQRTDIGRYRPPTMRGPNTWNDEGGYSYNLPNSFGPRPDFGEFNSPYAPWRPNRGGGRGGRMGDMMDRGPGWGSEDMDWNTPGKPSPGDWRETLRQRLAELHSGGGVQAGPSPTGVVPSDADINLVPGGGPAGLPPGAMPSPVGGYILNGVHYQRDGTPVSGAPDAGGGKPPSDDGYKGPDAVDPMPDPRTDPEGYNYWMHRQTTGGVQQTPELPAGMPYFQSQNDFDAYRWGNVRPIYWPQG